MNSVNLRGKFLVLDGPDGGGKTSVRGPIGDRLRRWGLKVVQCRDPGGTQLGERIRSLVLNHTQSSMSVTTETLLFMASRAQLVEDVIRPALADGCVVIGDRFVSATCAYQVAAGFALSDVLALARQAIGSTWPDVTFVLDVPVSTGFARLKNRYTRSATSPGSGSAATAGQRDSIERRSRVFHDAVRRQFLALPEVYPSPVEVVDATRPLDRVAEQIISRLTARFCATSSAARIAV